MVNMSLLLPCGGIHDDANKILKLKKKEKKWQNPFTS